MKESIKARCSSLFFAMMLICGSSFAQGKINVLVFSKTAVFRHQSIGSGKVALGKMAKDKDFNVSFTEDASLFNERNLKKYNAVLFLNTTGDVLDNEQQSAFERYIQAGGGYVGVHAASDTEYGWPWYGKLVGAYFLDHPSTPSNVQKGKYEVSIKNHWGTQGMPDEFERSDEFYSYKDVSQNITVLLRIDEKSYTGGKNGDNHPMAWFQEFEGGRSFYTGMGHTDESYLEPLFLDHLYAGIKYAAGLPSAGGDASKPLDFSKARPEENRFTKVVLQDKLDEPMELTNLNDGRILFIQRKGEVKLYNIKSKETKTIAKIPVSGKYISKEGKESTAEDGLLGLNKDPNFAQNHWIYLYYSAPESSKNVLARYELKGDELVMESKKVLLDVATQREQCCHTGGSIAWDKSGNLYLSTGDNTNPHGSDGYSPSDEQEGRSAWDAQKSSANTNDLRGKIIRIKPHDDGTYGIPEGNLFPKESKDTRPEIFTMGHRNPFRISVDQKTGYVYWGEVGSDASSADSTRGPAGQDEIGQARKAGNFGWPHFVGDNKPYYKYDFAAKRSLGKWNADAPLNTSPNNTGIKKLPPAQKAFIWYPYSESKEFPLVGSGGRNAMAGPVFYHDDFSKAKRAFPTYYDGKLLTYDWMRGWIMSVTMDKEGNYVSMERFMPSYKFNNPMDMEFDENGDLYMLEYGSGWFTANDDARLVRIEYNGGNRKPQIQMVSNSRGGAAPFYLKLSSKGTVDADGDILKFVWKIASKNGFNRVINTQNVNMTLIKVGTYKVTLTVSDDNGAVASQSMEVIVGNEPPVLSLEIPNRTFFVANKSIDYVIKVSDKEDGILGKGISEDQVAVNIDYLPEGFDKIQIAQGHRSADENALFATGKKLIETSDCVACHSVDKKSIGPTFREVSAKYKGDNTALEKLTKKVITGGSGVWGEVAMAGHPQLSTADAAEMVKYITSLSNEKTKDQTLPTTGKYLTKIPIRDKGKGIFIIRASYKDKGVNGLPAMSSEQSFVLRNARVDLHSFDEYDNINRMAYANNNMAIPSRSGAFMALKQIDLRKVVELQISASAPIQQLNAGGGKVELHLGSPKGELIGQSIFLEPSDKMGPPLTIPIQVPAHIDAKLQDLYLVFINQKTPGLPVMVVNRVDFKFREND